MEQKPPVLGPDLTVALLKQLTKLEAKRSFKLSWQRLRSLTSASFGVSPEQVTEEQARRVLGALIREHGRVEITEPEKIPNSLIAKRNPGGRRQADDSEKRRAKLRCAWLDAKKGERSDLDIHKAGGPTYNTIRRWRSGRLSTRESYVRGKLAKVLKCDISEVPK